MILVANISVEGAVFFAGGALLCYLLLWWKNHDFKASQSLKGRCLVEEGRREAETILREARLNANEEALKLREQAEQSFTTRRHELNELERRLNERDALINRQLEGVVAAEKTLREQTESVEKKTQAAEGLQRELTELTRQRREQLQAVSRLSEAEARAWLLKETEQEALREANNLSRHILEEARTRAEEKARRIISVAIQRYAGEHTFEISTTTVTLSGDEIKGRIIGREGRNIRAFEAATGVTVLIDDTPNAVVLSGFDPVRREIARSAMERLILDGRIHPTRIEEVVTKVTQEMDEIIIRSGEDAVLKVGLPPMHLEIVKLLGRLRFRNSYSQNVLDHSIEVAHLMGLMAAELGVDIAQAKRAGLLHDIGKAISHEVEGAHAIIGAELIKRYGEDEVVINGVASHHNEVPPVGPLGLLVSAADAISASRPGARSETMTTYLKRVGDLESIGLSFSGVEKCFAIQAGRELRVFVEPDRANDEEAFALARNIARRVEEKLQYPGQIRIVVVRETRCVEFAK